MRKTKIKVVAEAQAIAREIVVTHGLGTNDALAIARSWFSCGNISDTWRETLTVHNLNSKLTSTLLVR